MEEKRKFKKNSSEEDSATASTTSDEFSEWQKEMGETPKPSSAKTDSPTIQSKIKEPEKALPESKQEEDQEEDPLDKEDESEEDDQTDDQEEDLFDDLEEKEDKKDQPLADAPASEPARTFTAQTHLSDSVDDQENSSQSPPTSTEEPEAPPERSNPPEEVKINTLDDLAQEDDNRSLPEKPSQPGVYDEEDMKIPPLNAHKGGGYSFGNPSMDDVTYQNNRRANQYNSNFHNSPFNNDFSRVPKRGGSKLHLLILLIIGLLVIGGTVYLLKYQYKGLPFLSSSSPSPTPNMQTVPPSPEPTPSPTPPPIDRTKFKLRVLNGTTTTGLAASVSAKLKDLGYQIERIGNATNSAFLKSIIRVKDNQSTLSGQLVQDLSPDFSADVQVNLKSSETVDSEIILGK